MNTSKGIIEQSLMVASLLNAESLNCVIAAWMTIPHRESGLGSRDRLVVGSKPMSNVMFAFKLAVLQRSKTALRGKRSMHVDTCTMCMHAGVCTTMHIMNTRARHTYEMPHVVPQVAVAFPW